MRYPYTVFEQPVNRSFKRPYYYSMKYYQLLPIILICLAACHQPDQSAQENATDVPLAAQSTAASGTSNIITITTPCAIFCTPDSTKIEAIEKTNTDEAFYTLADDNLNYMAADKELLESKGIKIIDVTNNNTLHFKLSDGTSHKIDMNDPKYGWEIFLFDGKTMPFRANINDIPASLNSYNME